MFTQTRNRAAGQGKVIKPPAAEAELKRLEREWFDAVVKGDAEALNRILADDFAALHDDGSFINKAKMIELKSNCSTFNLNDAEHSLYFTPQRLPEAAAVDLPIQSFVARLQIFFAEDVALHPDFGREPSVGFQLAFEIGAVDEDFEPQFAGVDVDQNQIACGMRIFDFAPGEDASAHCVVGLVHLSARVPLGERGEERVFGLCDYARAV